MRPAQVLLCELSIRSGVIQATIKLIPDLEEWVNNCIFEFVIELSG